MGLDARRQRTLTDRTTAGARRPPRGRALPTAGAGSRAPPWVESPRSASDPNLPDGRNLYDRIPTAHMLGSATPFPAGLSYGWGNPFDYDGFLDRLTAHV